MEDYKPNSNLSKRQKNDSENKPEKKIERVVSTDVKLKKKNGFQKFFGSFVQEDAESVGSYLVNGILIPAFQKTLLDLINNGSEMMILGPNGKRDRKRSPGSRVSYRDYYDDRRDDYRDRDRREVSRGYDFDDIVLDSRDDAETVLMRMDEIIDQYDGIVTVSDLYDLVGAPSRHTDNKYGWTSLRNASVRRVRDGYALQLPRPMAID